jgi:mxaK protein
MEEDMSVEISQGSATVLMPSRSAWLLLFLSAIGVAWSWMELHRSDLAAAQIRLLLGGQDLTPEELATAPLEVRLARAVDLAAHDRHEEAQDAYASLSERGERSFRVKTLFNLANLHLRRALDHVEKAEIDQALPFVELAKESYRKALRLDPTHWDSKYNLEVAMRLLPEMDRRHENQEEPDEREANEALWSTVPGFPRGLP